MKLARILAGVGGLAAAAIMLSTIHPWGNPRRAAVPDAPLLQGASLPENVGAILAAKCGDCHSERTRYPLYAHVAPVSWIIDRDITGGRAGMNMSQWHWMSDESRISVLTRMASTVHSGEMPPRMYVLLHPGARLSPEEQQQLYEWARSERKRLRQLVSQRSDSSALQSGTTKQ
jgi:cytochrome c